MVDLQDFENSEKLCNLIDFVDQVFNYLPLIYPLHPLNAVFLTY